MLSEHDKSFITDEMMIELSSIEDRLNELEIVNYKDDIELAISRFIEAIISQNESGNTRDILSIEDSYAEMFINDYASKLSDTMDSDVAKWTLDSLRHAFVSFAFNGLHQLYTRQENEVWYPKILLRKTLEPNDIDSLDEEFFIFRGCDKSELEFGNFGQSWSTDEKSAWEFAFEHYQLQDWFKIENRVVLRARHNKSDVLFSDQTEFGEYEIAVKIGSLTDVTRYST